MMRQYDSLESVAKIWAQTDVWLSSSFWTKSAVVRCFGPQQKPFGGRSFAHAFHGDVVKSGRIGHHSWLHINMNHTDISALMIMNKHLDSL